MLLSEHKTAIWLLSLALLLSQSVPVALAEEGPGTLGSLLRPLGEARPAKLSSLVEGEGRFVFEEGAANYPAGQWVRWGHPMPPALRSHLKCRDGSVFVAKADWSTKVPISLADGHLQLEHSVFGQLKIPSHKVELWLLAAASEPSLARNIAAEIRAAPTMAEDRVWLTSGDSFSGQALSFDGLLRFRAAGQEIQLTAADVAAVAFATRSEGAQPSLPKYWFGFEDGTLVSAATLTLLPERIVATTLSGIELTGKRSPQLVYVQSLDGIAYLSDAKPLDYRHTPYFDIHWPLETDRNLDHELPRAGRLHYRKCLAMRTAARSVYQVPPGTTHFAAQIAIDDSSGQQGSAIFRIYRVVDERPELAYESPVVRGSDSPQSVKVEMTGAGLVILVVDFADFGDELDHCLWLDPRWVTAAE